MTKYSIYRRYLVTSEHAAGFDCGEICVVSRNRSIAVTGPQRGEFSLASLPPAAHFGWPCFASTSAEEYGASHAGNDAQRAPVGGYG